jgi:hypothetical protein
MAYARRRLLLSAPLSDIGARPRTASAPCSPKPNASRRSKPGGAVMTGFADRPRLIGRMRLFAAGDDGAPCRSTMARARAVRDPTTLREIIRASTRRVAR